MKLLDIHAHCNFKAFATDAEAVIRDSLAADVGMFLVGTQLATSRRAVALAEQFANDPVWAVIGQHPVHTGRHEFDRAAFLALAKHPRVVAIGECGLDYYRLGEFWDDTNEDDGPPPIKSIPPDEHKKVQREIFAQQIEIAKAVSKPLMIHCRDAYADVAAMIREAGTPSFDIHCFTGTWADAKPLLDLGGYLSFTGIITFPKSDRIHEVIQKMPLDRIMSETDCPYLTPAPFRGQRNVPKHVEYVVRKIAELRGESFETVAQATMQNAQRLFRLTA